MTSYQEKCLELKKHLNKCLNLNIEVFGKQNGVVLCEQLQTLYSKYCSN